MREARKMAEITRKRAGAPVPDDDQSDSRIVLERLEHALRGFIEAKLSTLTSNWWAERVPEQVRSRAERRRQHDQTMWPWLSPRSGGVVDFLDFSDYKTIISAADNWDRAFRDSLLNREIVIAKLMELEPIRNAIAHHRELSPEQATLLRIYAQHLMVLLSTVPAASPSGTTPQLAQRPRSHASLARQITSAFCRGELDLSLRPDAPKPGWAGMPEVYVLDGLRQAGANDVQVRLFLTFTMAMDRARDSDRLWGLAEKLFIEKKWMYAPEEICSRSLTEVSSTLRESGVSQRHSIDSQAWLRIAQSVSQSASLPIQTAIFSGRGDAVELTEALQRKGEDGEPCFPLLRGPKIGTVWIRLLAYPGEAEISRLESLPVAVDTQVRKLTEYLGVTETAGMDIARASPVIAEAWARSVQHSGAEGPPSVANTPGALDPALWFFAKWGCTRCERARRMLPISSICEPCRFDFLSIKTRKAQSRGG